MKASCGSAYLCPVTSDRQLAAVIAVLPRELFQMPSVIIPRRRKIKAKAR